MDDLIRRQDAVDTHCELCTDKDKCSHNDICPDVEVFNLLPSAPQWIPVSERLPEKPNMYTVTDSKGDVVRFVFNDTESSRKYWLRCAKAWMPLPEPWRE